MSGEQGARSAGRFSRQIKNERPVGAELRSVALDLIGRDGLDRLSVRRLSRAAHYSPSAIAYHVTPFEKFVARTWFELHQRDIDPMFERWMAAHSDDVLTVCTTELLAWSRRQPLLAKFYTEYSPDPDHVVIAWDQCGVAAAEWETAGSPLRYLWWYFIRRNQAALALAMRQPVEADAIELLTRDIHQNRIDWIDARAAALVGTKSA